MKKGIITAALLTIVLTCASMVTVNAAKKEYKACESFKLNNGKKYQIANLNCVTKQGTTFSVYDLKVRSKNGDWKTIERNVLHLLVTDKHNLYYAKVSKNKNTIYKMNLKTHSKKKVLSGKRIGVFGCSGKYLYYGKYHPQYDTGYGVNMYAYNLKTKKSTLIAKYMGWLTYHKGYLLLQAAHTDADNSPTYVAKANGTGVKKITSSIESRVKGNFIYCTICRYGSNGMEVRVVKYSMKGKKIKTVVPWTTDFGKVESYATTMRQY